jgi:chitin disaccharide deacetylase
MTQETRLSTARWTGLPLLVLAVAWCLAGTAPAQEKEIRLIVRGDDIGSCHAANEACIRCFRDGVVRSVEIMVPTPWYKEAVKMLRQTPGLDVGVHLTLTSEWQFYKWGPVTHAPSLADDHGHFFPATSQRKDFPPRTGFLQAKPKLDEVERELQAQIELALADLPNVSHLSSHMGTPTASPELRAIVQKLSKKYRLPLEAPGARPAGGLGGPGATPDQKEAAMVRLLEKLTPGTWLLVDHPGLDVPEMQAIGHLGYETVAADRAGVTRAFTSDKVKETIRRRGIRLISYADYHRSRPGTP